MKDKKITRLKDLIKEVNSVENSTAFYAWRDVASNSLQTIFPNNKKVQDSIEKIVAYTYNDEGEYGRDITSSAIKSAVKILNGLIKDVEYGLGTQQPVGAKKTAAVVQVNNHLSQNMQQSTQVDINLQIKQAVEIKLRFIVEAFKEELTGKQLKELKEIQQSDDVDEVKKQRFFEKVKSFGLDVASGMLSGILANPDFIQQLTH